MGGRNLPTGCSPSPLMGGRWGWGWNKHPAKSPLIPLCQRGKWTADKHAPFEKREGLIRFLCLISFHPETAFSRCSSVNLQAYLCGVTVYASAQARDFLATTENCSFPIWKLNDCHPVFSDDNSLTAVSLWQPNLKIKVAAPLTTLLFARPVKSVLLIDKNGEWIYHK